MNENIFFFLRIPYICTVKCRKSRNIKMIIYPVSVGWRCFVLAECALEPLVLIEVIIEVEVEVVEIVVIEIEVEIIEFVEVVLESLVPPVLELLSLLSPLSSSLKQNRTSKHNIIYFFTK